MTELLWREISVFDHLRGGVGFSEYQQRPKKLKKQAQ
jgi:hypothetical protein